MSRLFAPKATTEQVIVASVEEQEEAEIKTAPTNEVSRTTEARIPRKKRPLSGEEL
jgi:hypothetical protein